jgi:hypothetical protein
MVDTMSDDYKENHEDSEIHTAIDDINCHKKCKDYIEEKKRHLATQVVLDKAIELA